MLKLRRIFDVVFYICILLCGNLLMFYYGETNINLIYGIVIVFSFLLMLFIISATMDTLFTTSDPINKINITKYRVIFFLE